MTDITNKDLTTVDPQVTGVTATGASQTQQPAGTVANETPLFDGTQQTEGVSTTDRTDAYIPSATQTDGVKSAEMSALEEQLVEKQSAVADIDAKIEANSVDQENKKNAYFAAGDTLEAASAAYDKATQEYTAAFAELEELQNSNVVSKFLSTITQKMAAAEEKVKTLEATMKKANEDYQKALQEREDAREEYTNSIQEGIDLKKEKESASKEVDTVQQQIKELSQQEANSQSQEASDAEGGNKPVEESGEGAESGENGESGSGENPPSDNTTDPTGENPEDPYQEEYDKLNALKEDAAREAEEREKRPDIHEMDLEDVDKLVELFCGELTHGEVQSLGLGLLDMVDEASKIFETKLTASAYSKSGAMATSDNASAKEHSEAQADFTEAVLQVSDVLNTNNVEFYNVSDQSNFELASHTLDRINDGEYIKTDTLQKQASVVKNIRVTEKTTTEAAETNDDKYKQYSDAILNELHDLISDSGDGISEQEYNYIKTNFDLKSSQDMESAFDYLENEARKHNITSAISEFDN